MYSSRMRTARSLPISPSMHCAGGCLLWLGVCSGGIPACNGADTPLPVDRILDTRFWKYYLAPTSLLAVTTKTRVTDGSRPAILHSLVVQSRKKRHFETFCYHGYKWIKNQTCFVFIWYLIVFCTDVYSLLLYFSTNLNHFLWFININNYK